jgi:hypothetical protein
MDRQLLEFFKFLAAQIPEMAIMFLGAIVCAAYWPRYPRPALLGFLGFGLMLLVSIASIAAVIFLPPHLNHHETWVLAIWTIRSFLFAIAYLLILAAIFRARRMPPPIPPDDRRL